MKYSKNTSKLLIYVLFKNRGISCIVYELFRIGNSTTNVIYRSSEGRHKFWKFSRSFVRKHGRCIQCYLWKSKL